MTRKKAFTLIELLVVISIIALLVSILMPALSKARFQAKSIVCKSNLHQWGLAINLYANDYDGKVPRQDFGSSGCNLWDVSMAFICYTNEYTNASGVTRPSVMVEYGIDQPEFKYCPLSSPELVADLEEIMDWYKPIFTMFVGYSWYGPRSSDGTYYPTGYPVKTFDKVASRKPIMSDCIQKAKNATPDLLPDDFAANYGMSNFWDFIWELWGDTDEKVWATHILKGNIVDSNLLFLDGHVEKRTRTEMEYRPYDADALLHFW